MTDDIQGLLLLGQAQGRDALKQKVCISVQLLKVYINPNYSLF